MVKSQRIKYSLYTIVFGMVFLGVLANENAILCSLPDESKRIADQKFPDWTLTLVGRLRLRTKVACTFQEERMSRFRSTPRIFKGTLNFERNKNLVLEYTHPQPLTITIEGEHCSILKNGEVENMPDEIAPLMSIIVTAVSFDLNSLCKKCDVYAEGNFNSWEFTIVPLNWPEMLSSRIERIRLIGKNDVINRIEIIANKRIVSVMNLELIP